VKGDKRASPKKRLDCFALSQDCGRKGTLLLDK
jgi:hypothetical protein